MKRSTLIPSLILGCALIGAPVSLRAQEHGAPQHAEAPKAEGHEAPAGEGQGATSGEEAGAGAAHGGPENGGPEHGGPEDGGAEHGGHHGPAAKLFGVEFGTFGAWALKVINFSIFGGILFFLLKGMLAAAFKARAEELVAALERAKKDKAEGEAQIRDLEAKMAGLQGELDGILSKADADAQAEKQRILEAAHAEAQAILAQTQAEIAHQQRLAEQELRALVADLAVEGAARRIEAQMQGATAAQAMDRAIQQVGGVR